LDEKVNKLTHTGFHVVYAENFHYFEFYPSYEEFDLFLQGVPIFEDFDSKKDRKLLKEYLAKFTTEKGIQLSRHRVVLVGKKV
jgi:hypothetical protein